MINPLLIALFCTPLAPPAEQGQERFYQIRLSNDEAQILVADETSPFTDFTLGARRLSSGYSPTEIHASAQWEGGYSLSLMYMGSWVANLRSPSEEVDLRCKER